MKARFPCLLASLALLSACAAKPPAPPLTTTGGRPEIVIPAPEERVRVSLATQEKGEGETLVSQSGSQLVFVRQVSKPVSDILYDFKPSGAPYVRTTYSLTAEARDTHVSARSEIVSNYGTASERARPFDTRSLRQTEQRSLLRLRAIVEKP